MVQAPQTGGGTEDDLAEQMLRDELRSELSQFDGNAVTMLSEIGARHRDNGGLEPLLAALLADDDEIIQRGASWLLLDRVRSGYELSESDWETVAHAGASISDWQSVLHVLQMTSQQACAASAASELATFASCHLRHDRAFLRAWSISALDTLAKGNPALAEQAMQAKTAGAGDPAASVRARVRNLA